MFDYINRIHDLGTLIDYIDYLRTSPIFPLKLLIFDFVHFYIFNYANRNKINFKTNTYYV